jgi:hypothetical protein
VPIILRAIQTEINLFPMLFLQIYKLLPTK